MRRHETHAMDGDAEAMTIEFQSFTRHDAEGASGLMADDDVLPHLLRWHAEGHQTALVTLIGVEGGAPRQPGAQMAVRDDAQYFGYLSGGCLEQAVSLEAQKVIADGKPRVVRYGKGSPYFDIQLPCGSGLDLYFNPCLRSDNLRTAIALRSQREFFALRTQIAGGLTTVERVSPQYAMAPFARSADNFERCYAPALRLLLLGSGPMLIGMAQLAAAAGLEFDIVTPDDGTGRALAMAGLAYVGSLDGVAGAFERLDAASAALLFFHDHEQEPELLLGLLNSPCFYIGVLGNHAVHRARLMRLTSLGASQSDLGRIHAPVGMIPGAKSKATMAIGALAAVMAEAKSRGLVP